MTTSGIGGSFTDPSQFGWSLTSNPDPALGRQEQAQKNMTQVGTSQNVLLATPDEMKDIPLPVITDHIGFQQAAANHPLLDVSFRQMREVSGGAVEDQTAKMLLYEGLKNLLSQKLQDKLNAEMQKPIAERDPDIRALDLALSFAANTISFIGRFAGSVDPNSPTLKTAAHYQSLPETSRKESSLFTSEVIKAFEQHINTLGPNTPGHDSFMESLNAIKGYLKGNTV